MTLLCSTLINEISGHVTYGYYESPCKKSCWLWCVWAYSRSSSTAPLILNLGSRYRSLVSYMSWPSSLCGKSPQYALSINLAWALHHSECFQRNGNLLLLVGIVLCFLGQAACSPATLLTMLPCLLHRNYIVEKNREKLKMCIRHCAAEWVPCNHWRGESLYLAGNRFQSYCL